MTRPTTDTLGIGFIGCGNVMEAYLQAASRLAAQDLVQVVAASGRERQRDWVQGELGIPAFYTDRDQLIASADVDIVLVLTPMPDHAETARAALLAGKHVLLEKPLATNLEDAAQLVELTHGCPGRLLCAPFTWLSPTFRTIWQRIHSGAIGRVVSARGRYGWAGPDWSAWFYQPGGGSIFDLAVYNVSTLIGLLGPVKRVMAMTGTAIPTRDIGGVTVSVEVEDNAHLVLDFGHARLASVISGFTLQQYRGPGLELYGTTGTIQMLGDDWDPDGYEMWQNEAGCWQCFKETHPDWSWTDGLRHLVTCIREGASPVVLPEHAYHVLEVMLAAHESSHEGRAVDIKSTCTLPAMQEAEQQIAAHRVHDRTRSHHNDIQ